MGLFITLSGDKNNICFFLYARFSGIFVYRIDCLLVVALDPRRFLVSFNTIVVTWIIQLKDSPVVGLQMMTTGGSRPYCYILLIIIYIIIIDNRATVMNK